MIKLSSKLTRLFSELVVQFSRRSLTTIQVNILLFNWGAFRAMNWSESNHREIRRIQHYRTKRKGGKYPCNDCEYEAATLATLTTLTPYLSAGLSTKEDKGELHCHLSCRSFWFVIPILPYFWSQCCAWNVGRNFFSRLFASNGLCSTHLVLSSGSGCVTLQKS